MRVGIHGDILGYGDGTSPNFGTGIEEDAAKISREQPDLTVRFERADGVVMWFEGGKQIAAPDWATADDDA